MEQQNTMGAQSAGAHNHKDKAFDWSKRQRLATLRPCSPATEKMLMRFAKRNKQPLRAGTRYFSFEQPIYASLFDDLCRHVRSFSMDSKSMSTESTGAMMEGIKSAFDRSLNHCKQVTELFSDSTSKIFNTYKKRFDEAARNPRAQQNEILSASLK